MGFPEQRLKRLRTSSSMRDLVRETNITVNDLVYPLFVRSGNGIKQPISSMTGCFHFSPDTIASEAAEIWDLGIPAVLLFGLPDAKDSTGKSAWLEHGPVHQAIKQIKARCPDLLVITDVCLCAYTDHGHCGIFEDEHINNDRTCAALARMALSHAQAGADIIAPSDMMDGRVKEIRACLENNGFAELAIMSYSAKYSSAFYGPFRDAADSAPSFGDRKTYQMDPANTDEAMREVELDITEGADIVMVKPALAFLDIIYRVKQQFKMPVAAYNVSGEYMMINTAAAAGCFNRETAMMEMLLSIKRAGADILITYFAKDAAVLLKSK